MTQYLTGTKGGAVTATLSAANVPLAPHTHPVSGTPSGTVTINGTTGPATQAWAEHRRRAGDRQLCSWAMRHGNPVGKVYGPASGGTAAPSAPAPSRLSGVTVGANHPSGATPFNIREPYLALYYIIAINGIYPTRP